MKRKLTKAQQFAEAWSQAIRMEELHEFSQFQDKYHGKTFDAVVRWFNSSSGEGSVSVDGHSFHLHFSAIKGVDKNGYAYPTEADQERLSMLPYNTPCKAKLYATYGMIAVEECEIGALV